MDVLWVTSNLPDPTTGGGASHEYELLRWAAQRHRVTLLAGELAPGARPPDAIADLGLVAVEGCHRPRPPQPPRPAVLWHSLRGGIPFEFWMARAKVAALQQEARLRASDLVHVSWAESAPIARDSARRRPTAFFASDAFSRHAVREVEHAATVRQQVYTRLQLRQTLAWERSYRDAGAVAVASSVDAAALAALGVQADVLPVALGDEWFEPPQAARDERLVAFVASLEYGPNVDAAAWLVEEVWPLVASGAPDARLVLVGRNPAARVRQAAASAGVEVHADVPDVRPWYWRASVVVVPVRLGAGMKNKVLHAIACGAPVVATTAAMEGIPAARDQVAIGDSPAELADAVRRLLDGPADARAQAERARPLATALAVDAVAPLLDALWDRAAREHGR